MPNQPQILVVGAGPVGLTMAVELYRHAVDCRLIDRLAKPAPFCKALGITPRTLEVWDDLGLVQQALSAGMGLKGAINWVSGDLQQAEKVGINLPDGAYGFIALAQYDVERILADHLTSLGGGIEREVELVELKQTGASVQCTLQHADGTIETIECDYVVGCDGGRSVVRRALDVKFEGEHYELTFLLADVELSDELERGYAYRMVRIEKGQMVGGGACIPVPGNRRRYRFSTGAPEQMIPQQLTSAGQAVAASATGIADQGPTLAQVQEALGWFFPPSMKASNMRWSAFYRISHRLAAKYRVGRVFLAGDAAHLHPPIGGQGLNTGVQDAYNLGWKLALAVRGLAAPHLLDSYDAERRMIGQQVVDRTTKRMNKMMAGKPDVQEPIREDSQLFLNYRGVGLAADVAGRAEQAADPSPRPSPTRGEGECVAGDRAADVSGLRRGFARYEMRLFDLLRGPKFTLLLYTSSATPKEDCAVFAKLAEEIRRRYTDLIEIYAIVHPDCTAPALEGLAMVIDGRNEFARQYAARSGGGFLIRPDGYVGYRGEPVEAEKLCAWFASVVNAAPGRGPGAK